MVEYTLQLTTVFGALSDETRRDMLGRVSKKQMSVGEIAKHYSLTFAAISKHLQVLEKAKLVTKERRGNEMLVVANPLALKAAASYMENLETVWNQRLDALDDLLKKQSSKISKKRK